MDDLIRVPCVMMRGGTSRGLFFLASDLPDDPARRDALLLAALGSGHAHQIDGVGGGHPATSKAAIIGPSMREGIDIDYLFAQVHVRERLVDTSPNCGNMLAAVGPFAISAGLVPVQDGITAVRMYNFNTRKVIESRVRTPGGRVRYEGDTAIDGVPGTGAPIHMAFLDAAGSKTAGLLPTGHPRETIDGLEVSCIDASVPMVIARAADLGKTGLEPPDALSEDRELMARLESLRIEAGRRMGIANAAALVIPKPALVSPAVHGGTLATRYFMPHQCHTALAITGAVGLATAAVTPGTVVAALAGPRELPTVVTLEHPAGRIEVRLERRPGIAEPIASVVRTARRLFEGSVLVSRSVIEPTP